MLKVTMLQTPRIELDGKEIVFPFKRVDALFYYMLVRRSATRQELTALLWESCDDATGLKNLRNTIYSLKKALGGEFLLAPNKTTLQVDSSWELCCDYDRFMTEDAPALYRGEFLQGFAVKQAFSFDIWMERTREALRERYLMLLFRRARQCAEAGDEEQAGLLASDYLREEPCDESVAAFLMNRYRSTHSYAKAADVYQRLRGHLAEELGTEPQKRTVELYFEIMDEWNGASADVSVVPELHPDALLAARCLSVFCGEATAARLIALSGGEESVISRGLLRLEEKGLIRRYEKGGVELWRFIDREAAEQLRSGISFSERQQLHRRAAEQLLKAQVSPTGELCREAAVQYAFAQETRLAVLYRVRALDLSSSRCCDPYPVLGSDSSFLPGFYWESELSACREALDAELRHGEDAELVRLDQLLTLCRGRIALFRGDLEQGNTLLGSLTGRTEDRDPLILLRSCALLAGECLFRQKYAVAERFVNAGEQLAEHSEDSIWSAVFLLLRGECFYLRKESDKALYYLSEALDLLTRMPDSRSVRIQTAAVREVTGCILSARGDYARASHSFRLALEAMDGDPWALEPWLCVNYGRTAYLLEDHARARKLFERAALSAENAGTLWGRSAAEAYLAWYCARDERFEAAAGHLRLAQEYAERTGSLLERGILDYISMLLRSRLDAERRSDPFLSPLLTFSAESYARMGVRELSDMAETCEFSELSRGLREGIMTRSRYRAAELYSRERHFMTE